MTKVQTINERLFDALTETLKEKLGENGFKAVMYHLAQFGVDFDHLAERVVDLHEGLVKIFGPRLAPILEKAIAEAFYKRHRYRLKHYWRLTLVELVNHGLALASRKRRPVYEWLDRRGW